jgi:hypothetical protein
MKRHTVLIGKKLHCMSIILSLLGMFKIFFLVHGSIPLTPSAASVSLIPQTAFLGGKVAQYPLCGIQVGAHGFNLPRSRRIAMKASGVSMVMPS